MNTTNIYNADFLDILFEGRNKDYGAYELRRSEDRRVRRALIGTVSIALVIVGGYVLSNNLFAASTGIRNEVKDPIVLNHVDLPPAEDKVIPPPPSLPTTPPPAVSSIKVTPPVITRDDLVRAEDEVVKLDSIGNKSIGVANIEGDDINGRDIPALLAGNGDSKVVEAPVVEREKIFTTVELMPSFPGGEAALLRFLHDNVRYPRVAQENEIQGIVFVQFVVDKEGNINDVKTIGATKGGGLEEESIRVVKKMPKWKPGKQNSQPVSVQFNLPVRYTLAN